MVKLKAICWLVALVLVWTLVPAKSIEPNIPTLALIHVTVIDGTGAPPQPDMTVLKIADIVVLSANPLEDINNTKRITAVLFQGQMYDRAALNRMLGSVAVNNGLK